MSIEVTIPDNIPKRGNAVTKTIGRWAFRAIGWRLFGHFPSEPKFIAIVAPHRSMWDFFLGMIVLFATGIKFSWMAKHTLFRWPIRGILIWLGGIPINRSAAHGVVNQTATAFEKHDKLIIAIMPQGTRTHDLTPVHEWKHGFYHIANRAHVDILPIHFNYAAKEICFGQTIEATQDKAVVLTLLQQFYDVRAADLARAE
ncbi:MAG: 1-acyl-sn-glycerol-3-phosphate acyltransferase [Chloroflexota bacterium]